MAGFLDAVLPFAGSALSAIGSFFGQREANEANVDLSREQMVFQERMANTSYQRQVADLKAAGLNPMLGFMHASGAPSPTGSMPVMHSAGGAAAQAAGEGLSRVSEHRMRLRDIRKREQEVNIQAPLEKVAGGASDTMEKVSTIVPAVSSAVSSAVQAVQDILTDDQPLAGRVARAAEGVTATAVEAKRFLDDRRQRVVDALVPDRPRADAPTDPRSYRFKGNYDTVMGQIKRIKDPADRKAARAQYLNQITVR